MSKDKTFNISATADDVAWIFYSTDDNDSADAEQILDDEASNAITAGHIDYNGEGPGDRVKAPKEL